MTTEQRSPPDPGPASRQEQARIRSIIERMADGILVVGADGIICFANPAAERLFARGASELIGTHLGVPTVAGESAEMDVIRPDGRTINVELRVVDSEWDGAPASIASLRDVTARHQAAEHAAQLARERLARAEAEAASHAKSEFIATMSHELRTPLNAIIGYADLLDLGVGGAATEAQRPQIARIRQSARHLLELVNEILDLATNDARHLALVCDRAPVAPTVDAAIALTQLAAEARAITLTRAGASEGAGLEYVGDEARVRQILVHLLGNAVKFTQPGGRATVRCGRTATPIEGARVHGPGPWICIEVADTGIGIPPRRLAAIFDPFVQVNGGRTRPADGSGLGLTISRRLARLMHGDITVRSELGAGSQFTLWLPAPTPEAAGSTATRSADEPLSPWVTGLAEVGASLAAELNAVVAAIVRRLRDDQLAPATPTRFSGHLAPFVATLASVLAALDDAGGRPSTRVTDGVELARTIADRHGADRHRTGWTLESLRLEWRIIAEELHGVALRCANVSASTIAAARATLDRLVEQAVDASAHAFSRAAAEQRD
jgi:signal transduction histidine kinase